MSNERFYLLLGLSLTCHALMFLLFALWFNARLKHLEGAE